MTATRDGQGRGAMTRQETTDIQRFLESVASSA